MESLYKYRGGIFFHIEWRDNFFFWPFSGCFLKVQDVVCVRCPSSCSLFFFFLVLRNVVFPFRSHSYLAALLKLSSCGEKKKERPTTYRAFLLSCQKYKILKKSSEFLLNE